MNKLIITALLMVGLVGMIGTAAADPQATYIMGLVVDTDGNEVVGTDVNVYLGTSCSGTLLGSCTTGTGPTPGNYYIFAGLLEPNDDITVYAVHSTLGSGYETTTAGADHSDGFNVAIQTIPIPEFPTIALPIAAILGLMFIISSRKKKE